MIIRKVRGQEKIHPVILTQAECTLAKNMGISIDQYVLEAIEKTATRKKWDWWFRKRWIHENHQDVLKVREEDEQDLLGRVYKNAEFLFFKNDDFPWLKIGEAGGMSLVARWFPNDSFEQGEDD